MSDRAYQLMDGLRKLTEKDAFDAMDHRTLAQMTDKDLAAWHAEQSPDSPQFIFATHEWNRRLLATELRTVRFAAFSAALIGVLGTLGGAVLGWVLGRM